MDPIYNDLDDKARAALDAADTVRAQEILDEVQVKGLEIRNPSAFVCKALRQHALPRGQRGASEMPAPDLFDPTTSPLYHTLDEKAQRQLDNAYKLRAKEIIEELEAKGGEIRNPSAFVSKALQTFPRPRG